MYAVNLCRGGRRGPPRRSSMPGLGTSGDAPPAATAEAGQPDGASPVDADPPRGSDPGPPPESPQSALTPVRNNRHGLPQAACTAWAARSSALRPAASTSSSGGGPSTSWESVVVSRGRRRKAEVPRFKS